MATRIVGENVNPLNSVLATSGLTNDRVSSLQLESSLGNCKLYKRCGQQNGGQKTAL